MTNKETRRLLLGDKDDQSDSPSSMTSQSNNENTTENKIDLKKFLSSQNQRLYAKN